MSRIGHTGRKQRGGAESWAERHHHRSGDGMEYYLYPSALARTYWYYAYAAGQARLEPGYRFQPKRAPGLLLHLVRRGTLRQQAAGVTRQVPVGGVCLMDRSTEIHTENRGEEPVELWWVSFDGRDLPHLYAELRADAEPLFHVPDEAAYEALFTRLIDLVATRPPGVEARVFATLAAMLAELFVSRAHREVPTALTGSGVALSDPVRKGVDYIVRNLGKHQLQVPQIADAAGLSPRQLNRLFRAELGATPQQYLRHYRMARAKSLLETTDYTMAQIAELVGAANQSHFAYVFRRATGMSPSAYRHGDGTP